MTREGQRLAIKIQYPGIRDSIDSDVNNVAGLLKLFRLIPEEIDFKPLLAEAKKQPHQEADYLREAEWLIQVAERLDGHPRHHRKIDRRNDFAQELEEEQAIQNFCQRSYGVRFPMYEKIQVSGPDAHPFYRELAAQGGGPPEWNFYKYLIDRQGRVVARSPSQTRPNDPQLIEAIEKLL